MIKWIVGLNGAGKTVFLEQKLDSYINEKNNVITNIRKVKYKDFDVKRLALLQSEEADENIWDYGRLCISNNTIRIYTDGIDYTPEFLNIITLLCRKGNILMLDEPELGLYGIEIDLLVKVLELLLPTYSEGYIATHCQELFSLQPENFYWCEKYKLEKITEKKLYEHIGQF